MDILQGFVNLQSPAASPKKNPSLTDGGKKRRSQLKQNIPGYFGIGTAIKALKEAGKISEVKALYQNVPLFKTLIDNSMMSLTKCYFELTSYIKNVEEFIQLVTTDQPPAPSYFLHDAVLNKQDNETNAFVI